MRIGLSSPGGRLMAVALGVWALPDLAVGAESGMPESLAGGFYAGVTQPIISLGHVTVILAIAVLATAWRTGPIAPTGFLLTSLAGCLLVIGGNIMPLAELGVGLSALFIGGLCLAGARLGSGSFVLVACLAGLVHGAAFGEVVVGADPAAIGGYLLALGLVQAVLMTGAALLAARLWPKGSALGADMRATGAAVAALGTVCFVTSI